MMPAIDHLIKVAKAEEREACAVEALRVPMKRDSRNPELARGWNEACRDIANRLRGKSICSGD